MSCFSKINLPLGIAVTGNATGVSFVAKGEPISVSYTNMALSAVDFFDLAAGRIWVGLRALLLGGVYGIMDFVAGVDEISMCIIAGSGLSKSGFRLRPVTSAKHAGQCPVALSGGQRPIVGLIERS